MFTRRAEREQDRADAAARHVEILEALGRLEPELAEGPPMPGLGSTVIVNLRDPATNAVRGVLFERGPGWLLLKGVDLLEQSGRATALEGDVVVELSKVDFVQILAAG